MKLKVYGALIAFVLAVASGIGVMWFMDKQIDQVLADAEQLNYDPFSVVLLEDDNTFANRQLSHFLMIDDGQSSLMLVVNSDIKKRPWGATIEHEVLLDGDYTDAFFDDELANFLQTYFVDQPILTGRSQIGLTGRFGSVIESSEINDSINGATIDISPLLITAQGSIRTGHLALTGNWRGLVLAIADEGNFNLNIKPLRFNTDGMYVTDAVFLGKQEMRSDGVSIVIDGLGDRFEFEIGEFSSTGFSDLLNSRIEADFSIDAKQISYVEGNESLVLNDFAMTSSLSGIDINNLSNLLDLTNQFQVASMMNRAVIDEANTLLKNGFVIEVSELKGTLNDAPFEIDARFQMPENDVADVGNPFSLFGLISEVSASANMSLNNRLLSVPELADSINGLLSAGALVANADDFTMAFTMEDGTPTLNGEVIQLPF